MRLLPIIRHLFLLLVLASAKDVSGQLAFAENRGQWADEVLYRAEVHGGYFYIDQEGITLQLLEEEFYTKLHDWWQNPDSGASGASHAVKMKFLGADMSGIAEGKKPNENVSHYFLGSDPSRWASDVPAFGQVHMNEVYNGIDLRFDGKNNQLKYEFIVDAYADPSQIEVGVEGADHMSLKEGDLVIETSVGAYREIAPFAYQIDNQGAIQPVPCQYQLKKGIVRYSFPKGYDKSRALIIDPEISFSTYVGSQSSNFGFTASYDGDGNLYAGAIVFGAFYPTVVGAYQFNFAGGVIDVGITKFNADGTDLLYSTYIGGTGNESPHSIIANDANELYILGSTGSSNFPVNADGAQTSFQGGNTAGGAGYTYEDGSDIFISKLSAEGGELLGSTYIGGTGNDGISTGTGLEFNYGDRFRGEIVIDASGNAYVASVTNSLDFPIVGGYASGINSILSGVIFKLSPNLNNIIWSTFSGGSGTESAISLQLADDNSVYFTGGTSSTDLPISENAFQNTNNGGFDGYVGHISADGSTLLHCTYTGTSGQDQNYFVQIDDDGDIYVIGQAEDANYPISDGVYANPNSGQYIQKLNPELTTGYWSTQVGAGSGGIDISPSAFLVSNCRQIYISGWGGNINNTGSTDGLPTTSNAFQSSTDGDDFYIIVLDVDASELAYATFFGGSSSPEHVDGGTSRFDKNGTVYQAVCAGCGGNDDFPSQPGVWSQSNPSSNCNLGVFKFELSSVSAVAEIDGEENICPGEPVNLVNESVGADTFEWSFGDGTESTDTTPNHSYTEPGEYEIVLYASDSQGCLTPDSTVILVNVGELPDVEVSDPDPICPGQSVQIFATGADDWLWSPADGLDFINVANPVFSGTNTTTYTVTGSTTCGSQIATVVAVVGNIDAGVSDDVDICPGDSTMLIAQGGSNYSWTPALGLSDPSIANPMAAPEFNTSYAVTITTGEGCEVTEIVTVYVLPGPPTLTGNSIYTSCNQAPVQLQVGGAETYFWEPPLGLSSTSIPNPVANPSEDTIYLVTGSNECGEDFKEIEVRVNEIHVSISSDSVVCFNTLFTMQASGGDTYSWQPRSLFGSPNAATTAATITETTLISVMGYDEDGCTDVATSLVEIYPRAIVRAGNDRVIYIGDEVQIESFSEYPITWQDSPYLSCLSCNYPIANPFETTTFFAEIVSPDGCVEIDSVRVSVRGNIYIPNAFSPDGDGLNDIFKAKGIDIVEFKMEIFDRWGELVFKSDRIENGWNGAKLDSDYYAQSGMYTYTVVAREAHGEIFEIIGHVMLLR
jgi:gliding motility-associated-like protein